MLLGMAQHLQFLNVLSGPCKLKYGVSVFRLLRQFFPQVFKLLFVGKHSHHSGHNLIDAGFEVVGHFL
jgi:hypothetical protein